MCIVHTVNSKALMKRLKKAGWKVVRSRDSHHQIRHPQAGGA
ncbi:MAG: type II toxin-antitoxin system HicA family toxin [Mariprofundales bacterium]|nr:type II toxin-antitoxin system HicA family toxin [Mariprofundales bacterium]